MKRSHDMTTHAVVSVLARQAATEATAANTDPNGPCPLVAVFLADTRSHLYHALDIRSLSALAQTCTTFATDMVKKQTGPLYLPPSWRRKLATNVCRDDLVLESNRRVVQRLYAANFFTGLNGAASNVRLNVTVDLNIRGRRCAALSLVGGEGPTGRSLVWRFESALRSIECLDDPVLDAPTRLAFREALLEVHKEKLQKARLNRAVPAPLHNEFVAAKKQLSDARQAVDEFRKRVRNLSRVDNYYGLSVCIKLGEAAKRLQEILPKVETLGEQVAKFKKERGMQGGGSGGNGPVVVTINDDDDEEENGAYEVDE